MTAPHRIFHGTLPYQDGQIVEKPDHRLAGEWRVFEGCDQINSFGWPAGTDEHEVQDCERDARAEVRRLVRLHRDLDLLEGGYDLSGMTHIQFFRLQVRLCHAKIRLARRFPSDPKAPTVIKLHRDQRNHYRWAHREANRWRMGR